jgi:stearoyl-CoA desaturase (Delta-9 desaturase)
MTAFSIMDHLDILNGWLRLSIWEYVVVTLILTHITIASVTIFLHRHQAHRSVELHPLISHFFRLWLWMTTGMVTQQWVSVHRKHHAFCEREGDPHSPQLEGINTVLWQGVELYKKAARDPETIKRFGHGTPDDWIERHIYKPYSTLGIKLMLIIQLFLFGPVGLTIWAIQMMWIPFTAAGVINGIGHYWGYRNFEVNDTSTNISPWGILIGGEELHNNHHAFPTSAKLSAKWYEFDIGWLYIKLLSFIGLATVKKVIPERHFNFAKTMPDEASLQGIMVHRYAVLIEYGKMMWGLGRNELQSSLATHSELAKKSTGEWHRLLCKDMTMLNAKDREDIESLLATSPLLRTLYDSYRTLQEIWGRSNASKEELIAQLQAWCVRAQSSGIAPLARFSNYLSAYA